MSEQRVVIFRSALSSNDINLVQKINDFIKEVEPKIISIQYTSYVTKKPDYDGYLRDLPTESALIHYMTTK